MSAPSQEVRLVPVNEDSLSRLLGERFTVLAGHRAPGSRAPFPAIAIGPTGVYVIDETLATNRLRVRRDVLFVDDEPTPALTQRVRRHALALQLLLGDALSDHRGRVTPVVWVRGAGTGVRRSAGGVRLLTDRTLRRTLRRGTAVLTDPDVAAMIRLAETRLIALEGKSA